MQAHSQSWTVLWGTGIFSDLLPRKRRRVRRCNRTFWGHLGSELSLWYGTGRSGWTSSSPFWDVKPYFNPSSILIMHWNGSQSTGTPGTDPRRPLQGLCQLSQHLTPFPAGHTKSRDSQRPDLLVLHISSTTDNLKAFWKYRAFPIQSLRVLLHVSET